jgi:hypothetical protein
MVAFRSRFIHDRLLFPSRAIGAILTEKRFVPYKCYYMVRDEILLVFCGSIFGFCRLFALLCYAMGCVARNCREETRRDGSFQSFLNGHSKQLSNESSLVSHLSFCHTLHVTFPYHIHDLKSPARVRQAVSNEKKPIPGFVKRLMNR